MVHELDEIVFIRRYIDKHSGDGRYRAEMFVMLTVDRPLLGVLAIVIGAALLAILSLMHRLGGGVDSAITSAA